MKKLTFLFFLACAGPIFAISPGVTVNLDAGELTGPPLNAMQADNTSGSPSGSLLLLIDLGSSGTASNILTAGHYVSGTNFILAAGGFNTSGGTNETNTQFFIPSALITGANINDEIALRWFPLITLAQFNANATPSGSTFFGTYNPAGGNPDGGNNWLLPSSGSLSLNFFTTDSDGGGSQLASAGLASTVVLVAPTPEPSTYLLLTTGLLAMWCLARRQKSPLPA